MLSLRLADGESHKDHRVELFAKMDKNRFIRVTNFFSFFEYQMTNSVVYM